eukprot:g1318.t1
MASDDRQEEKGASDTTKRDASVKEISFKQQQLMLVRSHCVINMAVSILNFSTRGEIMLKLLNGDTEKLSAYLGYWTSTTAAIEFLVNPTIGRLSDTIGRKPFLMLSPYAALVLKTWVLLKPSILSLTVERIVCDGLRTLCGSTMGQTAITDLVAADEVAKEFSSLYAYMGAAIVASPLIAAQMSSRGTYVAAIALAAVQLVTDQFFLKETLRPEDRSAAFEGVASPFDIVRLFTSGPALASISAVMALQYMVDPKIMVDPWFTLQVGSLKWTRRQSQLFTAFIGLGLMLGRKVTGITMDKKTGLGESGHTTLTNAVTIFSNLLLGMLPSSPSMIAVGILTIVGSQRMNGMKQMASRVSSDARLTTSPFGKGEFSGLIANLRALLVAIAPVIYARVYRTGLRFGRVGGTFLAAALVVASSEWIHRNFVRHQGSRKMGEKDARIEERNAAV